MDYKKEISSLLENVGVEICYMYPKRKDIKTPYVTYSIIDDSTNTQINSKEYIINLAVQVDVWAGPSNSTSDVSEKVKSEFLKVGFTRGFCQDLVDPSGLNRKTMRFEAKIDLRNNLVYR